MVPNAAGDQSPSAQFQSFMMLLWQHRCLANSAPLAPTSLQCGAASFPKSDAPPGSATRSSQQKRVKRRSSVQVFSVRWWSEEMGVPRSTLYHAIEQGHLNARKPNGGCAKIYPEDYLKWLEGDGSPSKSGVSPPTAPRHRPPAQVGAPAFRHVRWTELPDEMPRESGGS